MISWEFIQIQLKEVTLLSTFVRLSMATLFGGLIGMERGRRRQAAGLRTHILICLGAALVMVTNQYIVAEFEMADPSRLGAQVISGIGFIGVGTIIVDRQQQVRGLTTAAGLWACACIGLAIGIGFYSGAIIACVFQLATIVILNKLEHYIINKSRDMEVYAEFDNHSEINRFIHFLAENSIKVIMLEIVPPRNVTGSKESRAAAILTLRLPKRQLHISALGELECAPGVLLIEELR